MYAISNPGAACLGLFLSHGHFKASAHCWSEQNVTVHHMYVSNGIYNMIFFVNVIYITLFFIFFSLPLLDVIFIIVSFIIIFIHDKIPRVALLI